MTRKILVIGMGAGNPDHMTIQAIEALNRVDVLFLPNKGAEKDGLARVRREICERFIKQPHYRTEEFDVPQRRSAKGDYPETVADWHDAIERTYEGLLSKLDMDQCGAFLVWGDPTLYDSTMRILDRLQARRGIDFEYEIIPGITSVQALTAKHKIPLNRIGRSITITTGRKLAQEGLPAEVDTMVVMLDGETSFRHVHEDVDIWWGAYLGTPDEILLAGRLSDVSDQIQRVRDEARRANGWIMDTYLLRRPE